MHCCLLQISYIQGTPLYPASCRSLPFFAISEIGLPDRHCRNTSISGSGSGSSFDASQDATDSDVSSLISSNRGMDPHIGAQRAWTRPLLPCHRGGGTRTLGLRGEDRHIGAQGGGTRTLGPRGPSPFPPPSTTVRDCSGTSDPPPPPLPIPICYVPLSPYSNLSGTPAPWCRAIPLDPQRACPSPSSRNVRVPPP